MLIGVTGTLGAGKGTIASYCKKKGFRHLSVSAFLSGECARRGGTPTRAALREIANEYRAKGPSVLIEAVLADANPSKENVVVESLHTVAEVKYVQGLGGAVISVDAPLPVRWERVKSAGGEKDSGSYETFITEQNRQMASKNPNENNLRAAMEVADYRLENVGAEEELFQKIDHFLFPSH